MNVFVWIAERCGKKKPVPKREEVESVKKVPEPKQIKRRTAVEYSYDELPKIQFSKLKEKCDGEDTFVIPELSEEEIEKLKTMARTFWGEDSHILQKSSGGFRTGPVRRNAAYI